MALSAQDIARMLVDPAVTRQEVIAVTNGLTPAKLLAVAKNLNIVEIMMGMQKMRAVAHRRTRGTAPVPGTTAPGRLRRR